MPLHTFVVLALLSVGIGGPLLSRARGAEPIARVLPPPGIEVPNAVRQELDLSLARLWQRLETLAGNADRADAEVYLKAVDYALRHGEFYAEKEIAKANAAVATAAARLDALEAKQPSWKRQRGLVVRGYRSRLDDSAQPYGLVIPQDLDFDTPAPLYVWLHGRGDRQTDLHFIHERERSVGQIAPPGAIVLHPFGRHCLGFKTAGEVDVLEAVAHVRSQYAIDPDRIVLIGFSMGGAGAWHLGAHYTDLWCAVSPGAGFAETAQYNKLTPDKFPPPYEQKLWGCYDVPDYVRNLFNVPVIAYSGENDKQIQAAQIMEAAFAREGGQLRHLIGPKVEHRYEPETLKQLLALLHATVEKGRDRQPRRVALQTRTLRYPRQAWVEALGLRQHWDDSRIDAELKDNGELVVTTRNITALRLSPPQAAGQLRIDGQSLAAPSGAAAGRPLELVRRDDQWRFADAPSTDGRSAKRPGLQGPIDDVFLEPFLLVTPTGTSQHPQVAAWVNAELTHFRNRWRALCRGEARTKQDTEVTADDIQRYHLVLWGDVDSNRLIARVNGRLPIHWPNGEVQVDDQRFSGDRHVPVFIYPNPLNPARYVVLNSGLTFREAHDRTNSLQNPKLPDWAIVDVSLAPNAERAGRIVVADFFNENWEVKKRP